VRLVVNIAGFKHADPGTRQAGVQCVHERLGIKYEAEPRNVTIALNDLQVIR
jgi:hypothetical protein